MKKKLLSLAPALVLGSTLVIGGGTFALFSANASNSNNTFQAGTVRIALDKQDPSGQAYFNVPNMAPGDSVIQSVTITSQGSLALCYKMAVYFGGFLGTYDPNHLTYAVYPTQQDAEDGTNAINLSAPRSLDAQGGANDHETLWVKVTLPLAAGNIYQNQHGTGKIVVNGVQQAHNSTPVITQSQSSITNLSQIPTVSGMSLGSVVGSDQQLSGLGPAPSGIWNTNNAGSSAPNGVPVIFSSVVNDTTGVLNIQFDSDDVSEVYLDGQPIWLEHDWAQVQTVKLDVSPGYHTVQFFAENTLGENPVYSSQPNNAVLNTVVTDGSNNVLSTTANASQWSVQQPSGGASTYAPYMFGGSTQPSSGPLDSRYTTYSGANTGVPIGPVTLPQ